MYIDFQSDVLKLYLNLKRTQMKFSITKNICGYHTKLLPKNALLVKENIVKYFSNCRYVENSLNFKLNFAKPQILSLPHLIFIVF